MSAPVVSVGLPVFNGEAFLERAINSILSQTFADFELIIVDNASTDRTSEICRRYAGEDARVRYYRNEVNIGAVANHNRAFQLARGRYFKWAAHDDECAPGMLAACVAVLEADPAVVLAYPMAMLIDADGAPVEIYSSPVGIAHARPHRRLLQVIYQVFWSIPFYGVMTTEAVRKTRLVGAFHSSDYVFLGEMAMLGELREVPQVLFRRRLHAKRSLEANRSKAAYAAWLGGPHSRLCLKLPERERRVWEHFRAALRMPIGPLDRLLCCLVALTVDYLRDLMKWKGRLTEMWSRTPESLTASPPSSGGS